MANETVTKARFTPGPWHRNIRADGKYPTIFAGRNTHVAVAVQMPSAAETEANIDLISAAPEMYATLRRIVENPEARIGGHIRAEALFALARARGEA